VLATAGSGILMFNFVLVFLWAKVAFIGYGKVNYIGLFFFFEFSTIYLSFNTFLIFQI